MPMNDDKQDEFWDALLIKTRQLLGRYGEEDYCGRKDYLVVDDDYGWQRITIEVQNLKMFRPELVQSLRGLLSDLPGWHIVLAVDVPGKEQDWPLMGLTIRKHEIIDGLQRKYLPQEFQSISFPGSRPGTGYD